MCISAPSRPSSPASTGATGLVLTRATTAVVGIVGVNVLSLEVVGVEGETALLHERSHAVVGLEPQHPL
jgi:hypothetical protein